MTASKQPNDTATPDFLNHDRPPVPDLVVPRGVQPFHLANRPVRGRLVRLGPLAEALISRHAYAPDVARLMAARFAAEQAAGRLNPGLDPRLLMVSLVGLTLLPAAGMPIWRQLFASEGLGADAIRSHALALLERGLEMPA